MTPPLQRLDFALTERLREVLADRPCTEAELRKLSEDADAWARTLAAQVDGSELRLSELSADPASPLADIAAELRRIDELRPYLHEVRSLVKELEQRARQLRTEYLLHQAASARPLAD